MNGLRRALLALIAAGALSVAPVALAGGKDGGGNHNGKHRGKITICHATGSQTNPYVKITISFNAVAAHKRHQDGRDIIPAPAEGCPDEKKDHCKKHGDCKKDDHGTKDDNGTKNDNGTKDDHGTKDDNGTKDDGATKDDHGQKDDQH
jgi:hypothetical protein